ncbi:hypothetical protein N0V90_004860 [Kalmusia sp. IMI 367209]|nr:hypothetical protein N0V90_004860 [Kalmusia sp. IMI 367209]
MARLVRFFSDALVSTVDFLGGFNSNASTARTSLATDFNTPPVLVTDLTITFSAATVPSSDEMTDPSKWYRIEKDLYLHSAEQSAWLQVASAEETDLGPDDLVITDIRVSEQHPNNSSDDAVDPRPKWSLLKQPLQLEKQSQAPVPRLTMWHGRLESRRDDAWTPLRAGADGKFKILQISDTHMVTGVGQCKDATDAKGRLLPEEGADPLTVKFMGQILDLEKPDLVVLTGDQLHHDILDSQSALFKVVAPLIERSLPFVSVFGNHDDEGQYAISRE